MIKIRDIAYARFRCPDLEAMERFLTDFGFAVSREGTALHARGSDAAPYVVAVDEGAPGFVGLGFEASRAQDLETFAAAKGAKVEACEGPGGGMRVRVKDPDGVEIDVVHGRGSVAPLAVEASEPLNVGSERRRVGRRAVAAGPPRVKRLGHAGLLVKDFAQSAAWYREHFGMIASDEIYLGAPENRIAAFLRCDLGSEYTDHHSLVCLAPPGAPVGLDHVSFEVEDVDAVMVGHEHMASAGYEHKMGVGRHILGSQIYDYWKDPWGHVFEHYTDGDLLDANEATGQHGPEVALGTHWGTMAP